ncbi:hypothetical protein QTO34_019398 [Cnephaeus nilssonii]|uniref:Uncharacterized protein n=1 Tax=Cnephaeus nilssonii TaxID=3371016 RepID=A0AA40HWM7_CNENI|nr:hypothetical protein QTO34_019398 [Eptesicus nilssonii]
MQHKIIRKLDGGSCKKLLGTTGEITGGHEAKPHSYMAFIHIQDEKETRCGVSLGCGPRQLPRLLVTQANESSSEKPSEIMTGAMRGWEIDRSISVSLGAHTIKEQGRPTTNRPSDSGIPRCPGPDATVCEALQPAQGRGWVKPGQKGTVAS